MYFYIYGNSIVKTFDCIGMSETADLDSIKPKISHILKSVSGQNSRKVKRMSMCGLNLNSNLQIRMKKKILLKYWCSNVIKRNMR